MGDGGKWVCGLERIVPKKKCVMYSFGTDLVSFGSDRTLKSAARYQWRVVVRSGYHEGSTGLRALWL